MSLPQAALSGLFWTGLSSYLSQVLQLATGLVLAGLLAPADFGAFALAGVVIGFLGLVQGLGLGEALIQFQGEIKEAADTAFWLLLVTGLLLFAACFTTAPAAAAIFATPAIEPMIRVLGASFILSAVRGVHERLLQRDLRFRTRAVPGLVGGIVYAGVALGLAWRGLGVWSIVYGSIASNAVTTALYWVLVPYRPALRLSWDMSRRLLRFGGLAQVNTILIFLHRLVDRAVIGRFLGASATGYYDFGFRVGSFPETRVAFLFNGVAFPLYTRLQSDVARLARTHLTATRYLALVAAPMAFAIAFIGPTFIQALYGDKWLPAVPLLMVLSLHGLSSTVLGPSGIVYYALGKPLLQTWVTGTQLLFVFGLVYVVTTTYGVLGVAVLVTLANIIAGLVAALLASRLLDLAPLQILKTLAIPLSVGLALLVIPLTILYGVSWTESFLLRAVAALLAYGVVYAGTIYLLDDSVRRHAHLLVRHPRRGLEALLKEGQA